MSQYRAIYLERNLKFFQGDDLYLTFSLIDNEGMIVTDLSGWVFKAILTNSVEEWQLSGVTNFSTSGSKLTLHIPNTDTDDVSYAGGYILELQGEEDSNIRTLWYDTIEFRKEQVDF